MELEKLYVPEDLWWPLMCVYNVECRAVFLSRGILHKVNTGTLPKIEKKGRKFP